MAFGKRRQWMNVDRETWIVIAYWEGLHHWIELIIILNKYFRHLTLNAI